MATGTPGKGLDNPLDHAQPRISYSLPPDFIFFYCFALPLVCAISSCLLDLSMDWITDHYFYRTLDRTLDRTFGPLDLLDFGHGPFSTDWTEHTPDHKDWIGSMDSR